MHRDVALEHMALRGCLTHPSVRSAAQQHRPAAARSQLPGRQGSDRVEVAHEEERIRGTEQACVLVVGKPPAIKGITCMSWRLRVTYAIPELYGICLRWQATAPPHSLSNCSELATAHFSRVSVTHTVSPTP